MNIDKMEAGREMDALIAEKVMGWKWYTLTRHDGSTRSMMYAPGASTTALVREYGLTEGKEADFCDMTAHPACSTNIAAAWEVVKQMRKKMFVLELYQAVPSDEWAVTFFVHCSIREQPDPIGYQCFAQTIELAICKAALGTMRDYA